MILTLAALALAASPTPPPVLLGGSADDRVAAVMRPSRSAYSGAIRRAATIPAGIRSWALCVSERESGGSYTARNPRSTAQGRWQFLDSQWRRGLSYMVADRLRDHGVPRPVARAIRVELARTPIAKWPGPYQDAGFVEVVERGGASHWNGPGC